MHRAPSQRSLRLWMGLAFASVAGALGAVNVIVALALLPHVRKAADISEDYVRCVTLLAGMRGRLSEMRGAVVIAHGREPLRPEPAAAAAKVSEARTALAALVTEYVPLQMEPAEVEAWRPIGQERLPRLSHEADEAVADLRLGPGHEVAIHAFLVDAEDVDRALERLEEAAARRATGTAAQIESSLRRFAFGGALLALLGSGAAFAMFLLAHLALQRWAAESEQRAADLEAFASRVAHDLRTPLQTILLSFASIARSAPGAEAASAKGRRNVERLQGLIEDLLEFSRAGAAPEAGATASVQAVLEELREEIEPRAAAAGARLGMAVEPALTVAASPGALRAIAANLIENALKYLGQGEERLVEVEARAEGTGVRLEVRDTGPGIPPQALPHVFEPFFRATQAPGGFGIGLATVRRLVEAHGGRVRVTSMPGRGTTFVVILPRAGRSGPVAPGPSRPGSAGSGP